MGTGDSFLGGPQYALTKPRDTHFTIRVDNNFMQRQRQLNLSSCLTKRHATIGGQWPVTEVVQIE
jgi:hypothetical protein